MTTDPFFKCHAFTGEHCEVNVDECMSSPCLHNATCVDLVHGYGCVCKPGFTGKRWTVVICSIFVYCYVNETHCTVYGRRSSHVAAFWVRTSGPAATYWIQLAVCHLSCCFKLYIHRPTFGKMFSSLMYFVCCQLKQHIQTVAAPPFINNSSLLKRWSEVGSHQRLFLMVWRRFEVFYTYS